MKKLVFILMIVLPILGFSQSSIGIKGGGAFSIIDYSKYVDERVLASPTFGIVYQHLFKRVLLTVEPGFMTKGFRNDYMVTDAFGNNIRNERIKYNFSYFEIPVLVGYNIIDKDAYFGLNAGFAANLLIIMRDNSDYPQPIDLSNPNFVLLDVVGGAYFGYNFSDHIFAAVNLRYGKGLIKVAQYADGSYNYFTTFINLGYKF